MHHFFVSPRSVGEEKLVISGSDVNHIKNALRMKPGEQILVSDGSGTDYLCRIDSMDSSQVEASIEEKMDSRELPVRICLFQGLPKSDKMELIIQKAVELGVYAIIPTATKNAVVKLDGKKEKSKLERWQAIAESAAKQSKRGMIPKIEPVLSFREALDTAGKLDAVWIPYENESGMAGTKSALEHIDSRIRSVGIFIGPEGGFDEKEIELAKEMGAVPVSLGKRILRTETAGIAVLALLMMKAEGAF